MTAEEIKAAFSRGCCVYIPNSHWFFWKNIDGTFEATCGDDECGCHVKEETWEGFVEINKNAFTEARIEYDPSI